MAEDIERLRAALDEAERLANAAGGDAWRMDDDGYIVERPEDRGVALPRRAYYADHILAWSPDVVLRLVERDRQLMVAARIASEAVETLIRDWLEEDGYAPLVAAGARLNALNEGLKAALTFWCPEPSPTTQEGAPE